MLGALNVFVQVAAFLVGAYVAIRYSFAYGAGLFGAVAVLHWLATRASSGLMWLHGLTMSPGEKELMVLRSELWGPGSNRAAPAAWRHISTACGLVFFACSCGLIWWTVARFS